MNQNNTSALASKPHFEILDGLRGIAALAVVLFHFMEIATPDYKDNFIPRSYLAVDFFFCLSGYVMGYAYDRKISSIGLLNFFVRRIIRLQPLVIIGSIVGLLAFLYDPFSDLVKAFSGLEVALLFLSSCLLIPYPIVPQRYFNLFHLNPPTWSLFWEYIANIFYALFICRMPLKIIGGLLVLSALLLSYESYSSGYLAVGFGGDNFWAGGIRLSYSFLAGIFLYRSKLKVKSPLNFWSIALLFTLVFFIPYSSTYGYLIDIVLVLLFFPLLISMSITTATLSDSQSKTCQRLGDLSYPLYMLHYPFVWLFMSYVEQQKPSLDEMAIIIAVSMCLIIAFAYLIFNCVDKPLRNYLTKRLYKL